MAEINFKVDENKCIHCGLCAKECIANVLEYNENKIPQAVKPESCIKCQHCFAACPVGAISIFDKNPENSEQVYSQNPEMVLNLIKSRRSVRAYKNQNLEQDKLLKLKEMLKWIPTGCNYHKLQFSFIDDVEVMNEFRNHLNEKLINALTKKPVKAITEKFSMYTNALLRGDDVIFRGAPHLVTVSNSVKAPCAKEDSIIALSYFELYAQSLGIGTCWCGFAHMCLMMFPELCEYLEIPEGYQPGYVMLFGPKNINYSRTSQPE
ncbi:MAG: nitroreductase family protein, partial [Candidatus Gastranaerophilales bacterium]|nr:nitroreductase family protein [Candidatus Gastranaerophilales bacterium]